MLKNAHFIVACLLELSSLIFVTRNAFIDATQLTYKIYIYNLLNATDYVNIAFTYI